ncbi:hypothetical protein QTO34_014892 [Cnephaeus nilssonii]|uniref:Uncharacterized protein n=1 Tax=Cnephaeus nilssonii TaxID=3371016 RepID=A0AA40LSQ5_CNENI|nr:hypothetical protein QTO34_014892 [Eptesicus nilssonii]
MELHSFITPAVSEESPPESEQTNMLQILVDTGSSNFAVAGAPHPYIDSYFDTQRSPDQDSGQEVACNRGPCT